MKTACIGIGAVGSIIARELKKLDTDVTLYSRKASDNFTILENDSYTRYDYPIHALNNRNHAVYDIIFISTKATSLKSLAEIIPEMSHDTTEIILCENGMGYDSWFMHPVPSVVYISGQKHDDYIEHFRDSKLIIDQKPYTHIDKLIEMIHMHPDVELNIEKNTDFKRLRYEKLLINLGVNSMTALTQNTARIFNDSEIISLTRSLLKEGQSIINQKTHMIDDDFVEQALTLYKSYPKHMGTSMYYDVKNQVPTEFEFIQEYFYKNKKGIQTPVLDVIYILLKGYHIDR